MCDVSELVGKTLKDITRSEDDDELIFTCDNGDSYRMFHRQDCCENVEIEDICGDLQDLIGSPILQAEESSSENKNPEDVDISDKYQDSFTWTFYRIATFYGSVVVRWYGESNGYYSESVDFEKISFNYFLRINMNKNIRNRASH